MTEPQTRTKYAYDASGNMTADGTGDAYAFDAENRMKSATGTPLGNYTYTYDGHGLRVEKSNGSTGTLYWRALSGDALAETDLNGNITSEYIYFGGRRISRRDGAGDIYFYNADASGTTRTITDAAGNVCYDADFTPYGQEIVQHTNACPQNYKFTGYERDAETGLDYAFARYYSPRLGRFLSPDPLGGSLGDPQSLNRYSYTRNNPINLNDPSGMWNIPGYGGDGGGGGGGGINIGNLLNISQGLVSANDGFGWNEFGLMQIPVVALIGQFYIQAAPGVIPGYPDGYEGEASIYGVVGDGWELFSGIIGGDRISDLVRIANIKFQLSIRFKQLPGCAALLGGQAQAQSLLNNISFQDVSASTWSLSPDATSSDLQSFNAVVTGEATASTTWSTAGGSWNGGIFRTYVSSEFFATSLADSETLTMHEMDHPALNQGGHDGFPSYADIGASCSTGVYTPRQ